VTPRRSYVLEQGVEGRGRDPWHRAEGVSKNHEHINIIQVRGRGNPLRIGERKNRLAARATDLSSALVGLRGEVHYNGQFLASSPKFAKQN